MEGSNDKNNRLPHFGNFWNSIPAYRSYNVHLHASFCRPLSYPLICLGGYEFLRYSKICLENIYETLTEKPTPDVRWPVYWVNYDKEE